MTKSTVFFADANSETLLQAIEKARLSFRFFWRELYWENRRIIPALDMALVKVDFSDGDIHEHMWVNELEFDGSRISGILVNQPNELTNINLGDVAEFDLNSLTDWIFLQSDRVYGAFSIHEMRRQMSAEERAQHDDAWGLPFGDPEDPELPDNVGANHPMAENMVDSLITFLKENPEEITAQDDLGYTMLHHEAIAGNAPMIELLLSMGADKKAKTSNGDTAFDLALKVGWKEESESLK